jgi:hypothetical protein
MNARSALMTRMGFPALLGAVLALALALISGLGVTGGANNLGLNRAIQMAKRSVSAVLRLSLATWHLVAMAQATWFDTATSP